MADAAVRVFAHSNALLVSHVRNLLEAAGIPAQLRNMTLGGAPASCRWGSANPRYG